MRTVSKIALGAGAGYVAYGVYSVIASAPVVAMGCAIVGSFLIMLIGAITDWAHFDESVRIALCLLGPVTVIAVVAMVWSGNIISAILSVVGMGLVATVLGIFLQFVTAHWDTPERRFDERMAQGCDNGYDYDPTDGYCHCNHAHDYADELMVPKVWTIHGWSAEPAQNIERLKAAKATAAASASTTPAHGTFFENTKRRLTSPITLITVLVIVVIGCVQGWREQVAREAQEATPKPDPHAWLAEGRKAAGLD